MTDQNHVFARFRDDAPGATPQREMLNVRRRGSMGGTRAVEVVHVKSGRAAVQEQPDRPTNLRSAAWSDGFPVKPTVAAAAETFAPRPPEEPRAHIMPAWQPSETEHKVVAEQSPSPRPRGRPRKSPLQTATTSADPFDDQDDGVNCLRCGYRVQDSRAGRGLMTCAGCG
jgi:hypothetical protein